MTCCSQQSEVIPWKALSWHKGIKPQLQKHKAKLLDCLFSPLLTLLPVQTLQRLVKQRHAKAGSQSPLPEQQQFASYSEQRGLLLLVPLKQNSFLLSLLIKHNLFCLSAPRTQPRPGTARISCSITPQNSTEYFHSHPPPPLLHV